MKYLLLLAAALAGSTSAALAQTVLPSGAVAPTGAVAPDGAIIAPSMVPGSQRVNAADGGSPRAHRRDQKAPGMSHEDRKELRKLGKVRPSADGKL